MDVTCRSKDPTDEPSRTVTTVLGFPFGSFSRRRREAEQLSDRLGGIERQIADLRTSIERVSLLGHQHTEASSTATLEASREYTRAVQAITLDAARLHAEALSQQLISDQERKLAEIRREVRTMQRTQSAVNPPPSTSTPTRSSAGTVDPAFYVALEDRFRGDVSLVAKRQTAYLELVAGIATPDAPVLDLGCGRGEWLRLLDGAGIAAVGVDSNPAFVSELIDTSVNVVSADLLDFLEAADDQSASAITLFQVVEHMHLDVLLRVLGEAARVLRPGGLLIAETPNSLNLSVGASTFWIDPTHVRPLHPDLLMFCALYSGFVRVDGRFVNELDPSYRDITDPSVRQIAERMSGPGDFALLAWA